MSRESLKNVARLINVATKEVPAEESFLADLKRSIEVTDEKGWGLPSKTFKPSGINCKRASYYQVSGVEPDKGKSSYSMVGICNAGTDIHVRVQNAVIGMKENGIDCEWVDVEDFVKSRELTDLEVRAKTGTETKLYNKKYNMSFMCDGIVRYRGKYYILEFKTETSTKWYSRDGVDKKHYNQGICYSLNFGMDDVIFIYIDRDMLQMKSFMFHVTDEMRQTIIDYIEYVNGYVERKIAPPKPDIERRICQYCIYRTQCGKDK